jgi:anti-anti-sigma factor
LFWLKGKTMAMVEYALVQDTVEGQLEHARREAAYYQRLAKESSERRLKESETLSQLIARLRRTEKELARSRDELELRVQERTAELQTTNERLVHEMNERQRIAEIVRQTNEKLEDMNAALEREQSLLEAKVQQRTQELVQMQEDRLRELSAPLIPIMDHVVVLPLIGTVDHTRANQIMETLLHGVATHRATVTIIDVTGIRVIDAHVTQILVRAAQAVRLLGAKVILTGVQPQIAQALVNLGADLKGITTRATLQSGIAGVLKERCWTR